MARLAPLGYVADPEDEEERRRLLESSFGPPPPPPNLGTMSSGAIRQADIEAAAARGEQPWVETPAMRARLDQIASEPEREDAPDDPLAGLPAPVAQNPYAEEPLEEPEPVDETATRTSARQRGTDDEQSRGPSLGGYASQLSVSDFNPLEELERIRFEPPPDYRKVAETVYDDQGRFMGLEDTSATDYDRSDAATRAGELYGDATPSTRWEDDFLAHHERLADSDIRARGAIMSMLGRPEAADKFTEAERRHASDYDDQLAEARERDRGEQRVSKGLAQAIAASDLGISPEDAVQLRMNDPIVKAYQNGGYSQGLRGQGQQMKHLEMQMNALVRLGIANEKNKNEIVALLLRGINAQQVAEIYARKGLPPVDPNDPDAVAPPTQREEAIAELGRRLRVGKEEATRRWDGDTAGLTPEQIRKLDAQRVEIAGNVNDPIGKRAIRGEISRTEVSSEAKVENATEMVVEKARADPKYAVTMETDLKQSALELKHAIAGWNRMSQAGKEALVEFGAQGIGQVLANLTRSPEDRAHATAVWSVMNSLIQKRAGVAVSESEWGRTANELGLGQGIWDPFNSTSGVESFMNRAAEKMLTRYKTYDSIIGFKQAREAVKNAGAR